MDDFDDWYREQYPRFVTTLAASLGSRDEAVEVAGDAFTKAFEQWERVRRMDNPTGWTFRVALNGGRRRGRRRSAERTLGAHLTVSSLTATDAMDDLVDWVGPLPLRMRQVVVLRHVADLTEPAIAEVLDITRATVSSTLRDAYSRLAATIEPEEQQR